MPKLVLIAVFSAMLSVGCSKPAAVSTEDPNPVIKPRVETADLYSVADYTPARDASADLTMTIGRAEVDNKRIILEVGGQW